MAHIRTDTQSVTQITVIEPELGKQAEASSLMIERARFMARASPGSSQSACIAARTGVASSTTSNGSVRDLLQAAHKSPEFRKEWDQFDQLRNEIGPHLYEIAYFMDGSRLGMPSTLPEPYGRDSSGISWRI